jgi:dynactin 1
MSHLTDRIESLKAAVRFLRAENSYIKSQDLLAEVEQLPSYSSPQKEHSSGRTVVSVGNSDVTFALESKRLMKEARVLSATPNLVDLCSSSSAGSNRSWQGKSRAPEYQFQVEKERLNVMRLKVEKLLDMRRLPFAWSSKVS